VPNCAGEGSTSPAKKEVALDFAVPCSPTKSDYRVRDVRHQGGDGPADQKVEHSSRDIECWTQQALLGCASVLGGSTMGGKFDGGWGINVLYPAHGSIAGQWNIVATRPNPDHTRLLLARSE